MKIVLPFLTSRNETNVPGKGDRKLLKTVVQKTAILVFWIIAVNNVTAQNNYTGASGGSWGTGSNWSMGVPTATQDVTIPNNRNVTVNVAAVCKTLTIAGGNAANTITVGANSITVSGAVSIGAGTGNNDHKIITITTGFLTCTGITVTATGSNQRNSGIDVTGTGTVTVSGSITMGDANDEINYTSTGILKIGNTMSGGTFAAGTGTVQYYGDGTGGTSSNQTIATYSYYNLATLGNGIKTLAANTTIGNSLNVGSGTTLDLSTFTANRTTSAAGPLTVAGTLLVGGASNFPTNYTTMTMTGGTVNYDATTGGQTIASGPSYNVLGLLNTSGTQTAAGNITATTLNTTAGGTFNVGTSTLTVTNVTNAAIIRTQNTGATPISTGKTWGGTVQYDGAGQTVVSGNYAALNLAGSGTKTYAAAIPVSGALSVSTGVIANLGSFTSSANTLSLGSLGTAAGSFGSNASAATYKNNTFFTAASTGIINVATGTCTNPTITLSTIPAICTGSNSFTVPYSATTGSPNLYSISGSGITTVTNGTLPASPVTVGLSSPATPGSIPFTLSVSSNVTGCVSSNVNSSVTVNAQPTAVAGGSTAICSNGAYTLGSGEASSSNGTIAWTENGAGTITAGGTTLTPTYTAAAGDAGNTVTLTMTVSNNPCTPATATYSITVNAQPQVSAFAGNSVCTGGTGQLTVTTSAGTGPFTVIYNPGAVSQAGVVSGTPFNASPNPGTTTAYTLTSVTDANGCVRTTSFTASAATITINTNGTWVGTTTDWFTPSNWCGGAIPTTSTDVVIPAGGTQPSIGAPGAVCNNITINASATLTMNNTGTLSVNGNWNKQGTFTGNAGSTVTFDGTTQTISGTTTTFRNLTINSTTSTTMSIAANIAGILSVPVSKILNVGAVTLTINTGASASVSGTITNAGTITPTGTLTFNAGGTYNHNQNGGTIPTATWNTTSNCNITGVVATVPAVASFAPAGGFGNFTWNSASQTADLSLIGNLTNVKGNFTVTATNSGSLRLSNSGVTATLAVGGNFTMSAGEFYIGGTGGTNDWIVNVNGNFSLGGGTFDMAGGGGTSVLNVKGDVSITGGTLTESSSSTCTFNFNGTAAQAFSKTAGTISNTVNFAINSGAIVDFGTSVLNGTGPTFNLNSGGKIITANTNGVSATGSIQVSGTKTFSSAGNYEFGGANTGTFTTSPTANTVNNLVINRAAGVTLTNSIAVAGTLTLTSGNFAVGNNTLTLNGAYIAGSVNSLVTTSGSSVAYNCTGSGPFTLPAFTAINNLTFNSTGQTYDLNSSPTVSGTLTLTNGIVSIGGNTLTLNGAVVRTNGSLAGSNTSNLTVAGTAGSLFFDQAGTNNVLKNFTLNTGATATLGNTLNITAYDGSSSEGVLTVTGTATLTTGGFLNIKSNVNGTARIAAGRTTGGYISGNVSVERYIPQNSSKGWRLLASTTSGQTINAAWQEGGVGGMVNPNPGFGTKITAGGAITTSLATAQAAGFDTLSPGVSLFKYNATTDVLDVVSATNTGNIASEQGYFLFISGDRSPGQFTAGAPTTATVLRSKGTLFLGNQTAVATGASNYGLVRNPYPSRIDMKNIVRGSNLIDAYQVWDSKLGGIFGVGGFQTFSKSGSDYVVSPGGGSYGANGSVHNYIESGAAFYIQSVSNTNNTAQVTEACKVAGSSNESYRPAGVLAEDKRLAFSLYAINPTSTDAVDGGLVFFNETYSNDVDILDVRKSGNFSENFGIRRNNLDLVVERRKDVTGNDTIPFRMYQLRQISYRLDLENTGFDPAAVNVVLQDKYTGTNTQLDLSTITSYTFTVSGVAGTFATDRFRLVLATSSGNTFSGTGNWTDNARWSKGTPPAPADVVTIAADANATLNTDFTIAGSLTMTPTSTLVVNPTKTLSVSGSADLAGQSVTFKSDASGYGSLGAVTGTLSGATNVTVERYIPNNSFRSWRLLSVPTYGNGQTIRQAWQEGNANPLPLQNNLPNYGTQVTGAFSTQAAAAAAGFDDASANASLLSWNGTGWNNVTSTNTAIANNKAYFMFVRGERSKGVTGAATNSSATTLRTNGTVYTGNQVFNVPTGSFTLVANTYPSAINFTSLTRNNVSNLFYIWDSKKQNGNSLGVYQTFSGTNSFNCLIAGGSYTLGQPNTIIESGQAFFVTGGSTAGGGTITLLEAAKISGSNGNLGLRPAAMPAKISSRLYDANNEVIDANVVVFDAAYNKAVDADDAVKFGNPGANFAIETNSKILAIEGTQPVADKDVIQFRMWNLQQQDYKLEFVAGNMAAQDLYAVLEDNYLKTNKEVDLKGSTAIKFTVDANPASSSANRFRIVFSKNKPETGITVKPAYTIAPNPVENGSVNLLLKNQPAGKYRVKILGTAGQIITTKVINHQGGSSNQVIILPAKIMAGNYQLEIVAPDNSKTSKQLLVSKAR